MKVVLLLASEREIFEDDETVLKTDAGGDVAVAEEIPLETAPEPTAAPYLTPLKSPGHSKRTLPSLVSPSW